MNLSTKGELRLLVSLDFLPLHDEVVNSSCRLSEELKEQGLVLSEK